MNGHELKWFEAAIENRFFRGSYHIHSATITLKQQHSLKNT